MNRSLSAALLLVGGLALAGCASTPGEGELIADPYESLNRDVHALNKGLDAALIDPAGELYGIVAPDLVKLFVTNELNHLRLPGIFINRLLQGDIGSAGVALGRFSVNTVVGAGGLLDPATEFGLPYEQTDFGVTLAEWGAEEGIYHESPVFGPSTTRHLVGRVVDIFLDPTILITFGVIDAGSAVTIASDARTAAGIVNTRHQNDELIDDVLYKSDDSYLTARTGYIQSRRRFVSGGETDTEALPDIFDE